VDVGGQGNTLAEGDDGDRSTEVHAVAAPKRGDGHLALSLETA